MPRRLALLGVTAAGVALVTGCGGSGDSSSTSTSAPPPSSAVVPNSGLSGGACPSQVAPTSGKACQIADVGVELTNCKASNGPYDVQVAGISCKEGLALRGSLQARWVATVGPRGSDRALSPPPAVYQPWAVTGKFPQVRPTESTGWTCWATNTPQAIDHVCWHGSDVLLFKIS
jgi:hypothetical protein